MKVQCLSFLKFPPFDVTSSNYGFESSKFSYTRTPTVKSENAQNLAYAMFYISGAEKHENQTGHGK
jgi:hypothetical protein